MAKEDVPEIYFVRAVSCLIVVLFHSLEAVRRLMPVDLPLVWDAAIVALKFGTPLFILVSAYVLATAYAGRTVKKNLLAGRTKLLSAFLCMAIFYAALSWYIDDLSLIGFVQQLFENVLLAGYHGYFILIAIQFAGIFWWLDGLARALGPRKTLLISLAVNFTWLAFFNFVPPPNSSWDVFWYRVSWIPFPGWIFYFFAAYWAAVNAIRFRESISAHLLLISSAACLSFSLVMALYLEGIVPVDSSKRVDMLLLTPLAFAMLFSIGRFIARSSIVLFVSRHSFAIYLLHFFYIAAVDKLLGAHLDALPWYLAAAVLFGASTLLSAVTASIAHRVRYADFFIGPPGRLPKGSREIATSATSVSQ